MKRFLVTAVASMLGSGFFPVAPATFASLVWLAIYLFAPGGARLADPVVAACTTVVAIAVAHLAERQHGRDAHCIVIDEFVGMQVTFIGMAPALIPGIVGFVLFRIFDIAKPFPAGRSQRLPGGLGVVADDVFAGAYARLALLALSLVFTW
jgi:phosphatidylglycerophosphatase A